MPIELEPSQTLDFIVEEPPTNADGTAKTTFAPDEAKRGHRSISVSKLQASLTAVTDGLTTILKDIRVVGSFELTEVTVQAEVSAEGGISILGSGGKAGGKGAITLTFSKPGAIVKG